MNAIKNLLNKALAYMQGLPFSRQSRGNIWLIYMAIIFLFGTISLYIATWIYFTFWLAKAGLAELEKLIYILCGAPFIAALVMLHKNAVDTNNNGISDVIEDNREKEQK